MTFLNRNNIYRHCDIPAQGARFRPRGTAMKQLSWIQASHNGSTP
jgi:hypothetical protein